MSSTIEFLDPEQIAQRRAELLTEAGTDLASLRDRREGGLLDLESQGLLDELEDLEYLSGDH